MRAKAKFTIADLHLKKGSKSRDRAGKQTLKCWYVEQWVIEHLCCSSIDGKDCWLRVWSLAFASTKAQWFLKLKPLNINIQSFGRPEPNLCAFIDINSPCCAFVYKLFKHSWRGQCNSVVLSIMEVLSVLQLKWTKQICSLTWSSRTQKMFWKMLFIDHTINVYRV